MNIDSDCKIVILDEDNNHFDLSFKIIVIGDSGVGKSCLTMKGVKNIYEEKCEATVGFEFFSFNMKANDKIVKLQVWDTCGQEIYRSLITNFYRNSALAIIVYSIDNEKSFENTREWVKELKTYSSPDIQVFLIGTKNDLEEKRQVSKQKAQKLARELDISVFFEASAKSGDGAQNVFIEAGKILYQNYVQLTSNRNSRQTSLDNTPIDAYNSRIKLPAKTNEEPGKHLHTNKKGCCK